jgi:hypothetical protein
VSVAAGANADAGGGGCIASRGAGCGAGCGGSVTSGGWTWIAAWTMTRIYVDLIHDTGYATPFFSLCL